MEGFLIAARAVHYSSTISLAGVFAFLCFVAGSQPWPRLHRRLSRLAAAQVWCWQLLSGAAWLLFVSVQMSGQPIAATVRQGVVATVLHRTRFGQIWTLRLLLAVVLAALLVLPYGWRRGLWRWVGLAISGLRPWLARLGRARRRNPRAARRSPFDGGYTPPPCGGRLGWITRSARPAAERAAPRSN